MPKVSNKTLGCYDGRGGRNGSSEDNCHDDRVSKNNLCHRTIANVFFKRRIRDVSTYLASEHMNENIEAVINNNQQVIMTGRNNGSQLRRSRRVRVVNLKRIPFEESSWYRIFILHGDKYNKDYIVNNLLNYIAPNTFVPIMYKVCQNGTNFYVDDKRIAIALRKCNRKITTTQGYRLIIRITIPPFPYCEINAEFKEKLKYVMAKRYTPAKTLDLSKFHEDPDLISDYFCALFQPIILETVINIISEHIPDLEELNLDRNKLDMIQPLCTLKLKLLNLKILHIGENSIKNIDEIDAIKDLKLEELKLAGNPMCNDYQTRNDYIKDVQKRFPELLRLDGIYLWNLSCDVEDEEDNITAAQWTFPINTAQQVVSEFLQEYFRIFDSDKRESLFNSFAKDASFSMTVFNMYTTRTSNKLNGYFMNDKEDDKSIRQKLKRGRLQILALFSKMPRTSHYLNTLNMDISLITETMMFVTVTGMYKELDKKEQPIRYFKRTFMIVPEGTRCCIKNEQLHISRPTEEQLMELNSQPNAEETDSETTVPEIQMSDSTAQMADLEKQMSSLTTAEPSPAELPEDIKQQMTQKFSEQTNMNLQWSLRCLVDLEWNYDNAFSAFHTFQNQGQIPPEAFTK